MKKLFELDKVRLCSGVFSDAQKVGSEYLKRREPDRLLAPCYIAAGKKPRAERYGGWESREIAGHSLGHWLSASAAMYAATKDAELYKKLEYAVSELAALQDEDGYVGGVNKSALLNVFGGNFEVGGFSLAGIWVPWYSLHKIYAGLLDVYSYTEMEQALDVVEGMLDFAAEGLGRMSAADIERMLVCEHGGMNEVFAIGYELLKKPEYLAAAEKFTDMRVIAPLADGRDELTGMHANTQIPKVLGAEKIASVSERFSAFAGAADFFLETVLEHRSYSMGGHGNHEHFTPTDTEPTGVETCETCNSYNILKLISRRFLRTGNAAEFDAYERILYNHILAAQEPETGMKCYFMSTKPGHFKVYSTPYDAFWCCVGTGMESPALYGRDIYAYEGDTLYINLFIPSEVDFDGSRIELLGDFPYTGQMKAILKSGTGKRIAVRIPVWAERMSSDTEYTVRDGYMVFNSELTEKGISWNMPRKTAIYRAKGKPERISFFYGPILLAGAMGRESFPGTDFLDDHMALHHYTTPDEVKLIAGEELRIEPVDEEKMVFELPRELTSNNCPMQLVPYFSLHHERYTLYWEIADRKQLELEKSTESEYDVLDEIECGRQQSEIEHKYIAENSETGYFAPADRSYRAAFGGGEFGYELKASPDEELVLAVDYWGGDDSLWLDGKLLQRRFLVASDGMVLAHEYLSFSEEKIKTHLYPLAKTKNDALKIKFIPENEQSLAGGVFGIRLLKKA